MRVPDQAFGKNQLGLFGGLRFQAGDAGRGGAAALADLAVLRRKVGIVDPHQRLVLADGRAFAHQNRRDDPAFERLDDLDLAGRHDAAVAALDFIERGEIGPDQRR